MNNREFFMECWEQEFPIFVRVFRALPPHRLDYRPHPDSRSAADLVWLQVCEKQCWFELVRSGTIHWALPPSHRTLEEMIHLYERAHHELAVELRHIRDTNWSEQPVQFIAASQVEIETSLGHMFWLGLFDAIHHRGQLSSYIRPMGGKVPAIFGASSDDAGDLHRPLLGLDAIGAHR
jgi:uncharacterized damage-inducible protein DinB